tara:strand:+ start:3698 stop:5101 length:1404 start_codon:yes stop_codon:yes gene_type:complete
LKYISTRGKAPVLGFEDVMLSGLAVDGGLYVPQEWPSFTTKQISEMQGSSYNEIAEKVTMPFVDGELDNVTLRKLIEDSYSRFGHPDKAPLIQIEKNMWVLELFHGPTLAFKDFALQLLGNLFEEVLKRREQRITIVGATSGDTGSAAIEACKFRDNIDIFILHPEGRTSEIQRRQMTTVDAKNVHNISIQGSFDDCQDLVKLMFGDMDFRNNHNLSAVNSINWVRIMAQVVYYFTSALALGAPDKKISYAVPTGNFGDVFAGYVAKKMGLSIERLIVATNANDILSRFFERNDMSVRPVVSTLSPSMDIQVSSNFERLVFDLAQNDSGVVRRAIKSFRDTGHMELPFGMLESARQTFAAARLEDEGILAVIRSLWKSCNVVVDPHTATGIHAAKEKLSQHGNPVVALATAHPAKFPDSVAAAIGHSPRLPDKLSHIMSADEQYVVLPADIETVKQYVATHANSVGS